MSVLTVDNLNKSYGKQSILKDVSFSVKAGEIVGFIGPNGSGKSTTMKCIANLVFPDSGKIEIAGYDLSKSRNQALSHLSALIEAPGLYFNLSGMDNLQLFASLRSIPKKRVDEVIEFTGLGQRLKMRASNYSMGMKQRLALGIAILTKPTFLILDEPFSGLDPIGVFELREVIKNLAAEGCGIIFSSHQIMEMDRIANRNIFIKEGRIITQGTALLNDSMLNYKIFIEENNQVPSLLASLKESSVLADFHYDEDALYISLTSVDHLSAVLSRFLDKGLKIRGIAPVTANIENLYNSIYGHGA